MGENSFEAGMKDNADVLRVLGGKRTQFISELDRHDAELVGLQQEYSEKLARLKDEQRILQDALQHVEALLRLEGWEGQTREREDALRPTSSDAKPYVDYAYELLEAVAQPMHYKTLYDRLIAQGVFIPGKDGAATLLTKLGRDARFKRIHKRGTYALSFWRISAARPKARGSHKKKRK